jgi:hypothetical protein
VSGLLLTTAAEIATALEGRREGRQWRCRCPIHGGRSLLVRDGDAGRILVFCHGGCEARDVLTELRRSGLFRGTSENYQLPLMRRNDRPDEAARMKRALAVWRETRPAATRAPGMDVPVFGVIYFDRHTAETAGSISQAKKGHLTPQRCGLAFARRPKRQPCGLSQDRPDAFRVRPGSG